LKGFDDADDILEGGTGNDTLSGGRGNDTYIWNAGDGGDRIIESGGLDTLAFRGGISPDDVSVEVRGLDVVFVIGGERVTVVNWFGGESNHVENILFDDGTSWDREMIYHKIGSLIQGSSGADRLIGSDEADILVGSLGDDKLFGGGGDDKYVWAPGHGSDTILDAQGRNVLELDGVTADDLILSRDNRHLFIKHRETGEVIKVESWYSGSGNQLAEIRLADGTIWTAEHINSLFVEVKGSSDNDSLLAYDTDDVVYGYEGGDIISGLGGNDVLVGGKGDDKLYGGAGDDVYIWSRGDGNDRIRDNAGRNTLRFGDGIAARDLLVTRDAQHLYIKIGEEFVCVENWFGSEANKLDIEFADGVIWTKEAVEGALGNTASFNATEGDDVLHGTPEDDVIDGRGGNDKIYGGGGDDLIIGGKGRDILNGQDGDDTYFWSPGDGNDVVIDSLGHNRLEFGAGVEWTQVSAVAYGMDLALKFNETGEYIRVSGWFNDEANQLAEIVFSDGTTWTREYLNSLITVTKFDTASQYAYGADGRDLLIGSVGGDRIYGQGGDDSIIGGKGDDYLDGGTGDDVYFWNSGDGNDTISDSSGSNVLQFGEGILREDVAIRRNGADLRLVVLETGEQITISGWYSRTYRQLAEIRFADGSALTREEIAALPSVYSGTEGNDTLSGSGEADVLYGLGGKDKLYGYGGNDILVGGTGDDHLDGGAGDDTYIWNVGDGNDTISDNSGADVLRLGEGVLPSDVTFERSGSGEKDIVLVIGSTGERITIAGWFRGSDYQLARVEFSDGTVWTRLDIAAMSSVGHGTGEDDILHGTYINDTLMGYAGNDKLYGYAGKDTLIGGEGDDYLDGGAGDDTYIWNLGDGNDTIYDYYGSNVLEIGEDVNPKNVLLERIGRNLRLTIGETGEVITIKDWYYNNRNQLATMRFADGTIWTAQDVNEITAGIKEPFNISREAPVLEGFSLFPASYMLETYTPAVSDWSHDPILANIMNTPTAADIGSLEAANIDLSIAISILDFGTNGADQICEITGSPRSFSGEIYSPLSGGLQTCDAAMLFGTEESKSERLGE